MKIRTIMAWVVMSIGYAALGLMMVIAVAAS